jgi:glycosyltransferase involved in cell wall biosynthesis
MDEPELGILLCTYNGARYLTEQLESIADQSYRAWRLMISDDGSTDQTLEVAGNFKDAHPDRVRLTEGPRKGFAQNFMFLAKNPLFMAKLWAFCDQDDVWEHDKLARAAEALASVAPDVPALYCSRTTLTDAEGKYLGLSPLSRVQPAFTNALVQNIASGNTMVFNEAARRLLIEANDESIPFHDWLLYLVVTGCGGVVYYDPQPSLRYRQHGGNIVGYWGGIRGYLVRAGIMFRGEFRSWIDGNLKAINHIGDRLTDSNRQVLEAFTELRARGMIHRFAAIRRLKIVHQNPLAIFLAVLFNKL